MYARLLGPDWDRLDPAVRRAHEGESAGSFRIRWGTPSPLARLLGLPAPSDACPIRLRITPTERGERWHRTFRDRPLVTEQWPTPEGLLAERHGQLVLYFRLRVHGGGLDYEQVSATLMGLRLPRFLQPRVHAREEAAPGGGTRVRVEVRLPVFGLLIAYEGCIAP